MENIIDLDFPSEAFADLLSECIRELLPDDEHHTGKTGPDSIKYRVIEHSLAIWPHRVHLLQATVAAAHSGGEYEKCGAGRHREEK